MLFTIGTKENVAINSDEERKRMLWMLRMERKIVFCPVLQRQEGLSDPSYWILALFLEDHSKEDMRNEE